MFIFFLVVRVSNIIAMACTHPENIKKHPGYRGYRSGTLVENGSNKLWINQISSDLYCLIQNHRKISKNGRCTYYLTTLFNFTFMI